MKRKGSKEASQSFANPLVEALMTKKDSDISSGKFSDLPEMPDGMSAEELALGAGVSVKTLRERLRAMLSSGDLIVGRKQGKDLIGRSVWVPCYKMLKRESR